MSWQQMLFACFTVVFSALFQSFVVAIGYHTHNEFAWKVGLAGIGLTYVCFMLQVVKPDWHVVHGTAAACSICAGALAGFSLLVR